MPGAGCCGVAALLVASALALAQAAPSARASARGAPSGAPSKFPVGTIGNGTCGAVYLAGSCATDPVGYFEGVATMAACAAKVVACPKAQYASWSSLDHSCAWYSSCDMATLCVDCSAAGSCAVPHNPQCPACDKKCPHYWPHTSEVVRAAGPSPSPPPPPPPSPPGPPPAVYKCVLSTCVKTGPKSGTAYNSSTCDGACGPPTLTSLASLRMRTLAIGAVQPTGWLERQLATQVNGLSGHLQRFWPDVMNSSWIYPANNWEETYSDRGGNMPYATKSRSTKAQWRPSRFRLARRTYDAPAWGCIVRVANPTKSRNLPTTCCGFCF